MSRILVVEDEEKIARFVELELLHEGYEVAKAADGRAAVDLALSEDFDLILLDIMLPQLNGLEVLRRVRRVKQTPVILLTARDEVTDKVAGLDGGADDYITKPFAIEELLARIRLALRHRAPAVSAGEKGAPGAGEPGAASASLAAPVGSGSNVLLAGPVALDADGRCVSVGDVPVDLTAREFDVLHALMERPGVVLSREQLVQAACGWDFMGDTNVIDVYVSHIRSKIDDVFGIELITTVRGSGYVVRPR